MMMQQVLEIVCNKRQLNPTDHFLRVKIQGQDIHRVPEKEAYFLTEVCSIFPTARLAAPEVADRVCDLGSSEPCVGNMGMFIYTPLEAVYIIVSCFNNKLEKDVL